MNYYNENDPFAVKWLKELIKAKLIPDGEVDDRSILDVDVKDLKEFTQHHFFAGIGGWSYALELSGWDADRPVWTGSCPCQSLSCAGLQEGEKSKYHLWPVFFGLIQEFRPPEIFGEQVASKDGREWLSGVRNDLEAVGYAVGAADLPACSVGSPHKRNRLFWVAESDAKRCDCNSGQTRSRESKAIGGGEINGVGQSDSTGSFKGQQTAKGSRYGDTIEPASGNGGVADSERNGGRSNEQGRETQKRASNFWSNSTFIPCADGKARRVPGRVGNTSSGRLRGDNGRGARKKFAAGHIQFEDTNECEWYEIEPLLFPLADGFSNRVGALRGAGNAIVSQVAAEFIMAFMGCQQWGSECN